MNKTLDWEEWLAKNEALTAAILAQRGGKFVDVDAIWTESRMDLETRHDYLVFGYRSDQTDMQNSILVNYYNGAYGLTLLIVTHTENDLIFLKQLFSKLAGEEIAINFAELENVKLMGFKTLQLRQIREKAPGGLRIINKDAEALAFVWELSPLEWLECAELVDGLLAANTPGHQYLTSESSDDVLVKLSYKEFSLA